jgi:hypothetical protein
MCKSSAGKPPNKPIKKTTIVRIIVVAAVTFILSCVLFIGHHLLTPAPIPMGLWPIEAGSKLTKTQVIGIAEDAAKAEGYEIAKYELVTCCYAFTSWTFLFSPKLPTSGEEHLGIWVDDRTEKATLIRIE